MSYNMTMTAAAAARSPEEPFQALSRAAGLAMSARLPVATPLQPIVGQVEALLRHLPDVEREHAAPDGSWTAVLLSMPPAGPQPENALKGRPASLLDRIPGLATLCREFGTLPGLAVIARMPPGAVLGWHYDPVSPDHHMVRLHLPVRTHPLAVTDLCHERVHWPAGGLYYGDYGFPHRVLNGSAVERVHLYFDIPAAAVSAHLPPAMTAPVGDRCRLREDAVNLHLAVRAAALA